MGLLEKIKENWFLIGIIVVILAARAEPSIGLKGGKSVDGAVQYDSRSQNKILNLVFTCLLGQDNVL